MPDFELIIVSIKSLGSNSPDLSIALFYRPPNSSYSIPDTLFTTLCSDSFYFLVNGCSRQILIFLATSPLFFKWLSVDSSFNLSQVVTEPTHVSNSVF